MRMKSSRRAPPPIRARVVRVGRFRELADRDRYRLQCAGGGFHCQARADERRGEEQWRGLAGDACDRETTAPVTMPSIVCGSTTLGWCASAATPRAEVRLAERVRDEARDLDRRARDERQHDARQRERPREPAPSVAEYEEPVDEDADHDGGDAVEHVERQAHHVSNHRGGEFGEIDRDENLVAPRERRDRRRSRSVPGERVARPCRRAPRNDLEGVFMIKSRLSLLARRRGPTRR